MSSQEINKIIIHLSSKYGFKVIIQEIIAKYNENHRYYHTWDNHIVPMIESITEDYKNKEFLDVMLYDWDGKLSDEDVKLNDEIYDKLLLATIFHDVIYDPKSETNEVDSSSFMLENISNMSENFDVANMIMATRTHKGNNELQKLFIKYDLEILTKSFSELLVWEKQIQKEYSFVNWSEYKKERIKILNKLQSTSIEKININGIDALINVIETTTPKVAIYAGSFNPFHKGHMNILNKAEQIFDKVIIVKGLNAKKTPDLHQWLEEYENLRNLLPGFEVIKHEGLLTDLIKEQKDVDVTLIRGLRNGYDLDTENTQATFMKDMYPDLKIVYISSDKEFEHISSSAIREIRSYDEELVKKYLP